MEGILCPPSSFCSASFPSKRKHCLPARCGPKTPARQNGTKSLKKKKRRKNSEKADVCVPDAICLLVPLSSEKRICIFFPQAGRVEDPEKAGIYVPGRYQSFALPFLWKKNTDIFPHTKRDEVPCFSFCSLKR